MPWPVIRWGYIHEIRPFNKSNPICLNRCFWAIASCPRRTRGIEMLTGLDYGCRCRGRGFNDGNFTGEMTREGRGGAWLKNKAEKQAIWPQLHVRPSSSGFPRVCTAPSGIWLCIGSHSHTDTLRSSLRECMFLHMHLNMHTLAKWFRDIRAAWCLFKLSHLFPNQVLSQI